jgi:acyl-coenzyme A synthetase/AMP-(fatty) acid ligase
MKRPTSHVSSIRNLLANSPDRASRFLWSAENSVSLQDALFDTSLDGRILERAGRSVLLVAHDQLAAALAIMELDGVARQLIICPPDVSSDHIPALIDQADADAIVSDQDSPYIGERRSSLHVRASSAVAAAEPIDVDPVATDWVLLTSGTSGVPKIVAHSVATLTAPIKGSGNEK